MGKWQIKLPRGVRLYHNQRGTPPNMARYQFNFSVNKNRVFHTIVCKYSEVDTEFSKWKQRTRASLKGETDYGWLSLFESFRKYLHEYACTERTKKEFRAETSFFEKRLTVFFEDMDLNKFGQDHVKRYLKWRSGQPGRKHEDHLSASTLNKDINILGAFFRWCMEELDSHRLPIYRGANPCHKLRVNENNIREIQLTENQTLEIIEKSVAHGSDFHTAILLALTCGLRKKEVLGISWNNVFLHETDPNQRRIFIPAHLSKGKKETRKGRSVPIMDVLHQHLMSLPDHDGRVVKISESTLKRHYYALRKELPWIKDLTHGTLTFHDLRHAYAQLLLKAGVSLEDIKSFLGHKSVIITEKFYAQSGGYNGVQKVNKAYNVVNFNRLKNVP